MTRLTEEEKAIIEAIRAKYRGDHNIETLLGILDRISGPQSVAEIRGRILKTMCPTYSSSGGDHGIQGRISADDFSTLMRLLGADQ